MTSGHDLDCTYEREGEAVQMYGYASSTGHTS